MTWSMVITDYLIALSSLFVQQLLFELLRCEGTIYPLKVLVEHRVRARLVLLPLPEVQVDHGEAGSDEVDRAKLEEDGGIVQDRPQDEADRADGPVDGGEGFRR